MTVSLPTHETDHTIVQIRVCQHIEFRALYLLSSPGVRSRVPYHYPAPRLVSRDSASNLSGLSTLYGHYELRRLSRVALRLQLQPGDNQGTGPDLVDLGYKLNIDVPSLSAEGWDAIRSKVVEKLTITDKSGYLNNLPTTHVDQHGPHTFGVISIVSGVMMEVMDAMQEMTRALQRHRHEYNTALRTAAQSHKAVGDAAALGMYQRPALRSWTFCREQKVEAFEPSIADQQGRIVSRRSIIRKMRTLINSKARVTGAFQVDLQRHPKHPTPGPLMNLDSKFPGPCRRDEDADKPKSRTHAVAEVDIYAASVSEVEMQMGGSIANLDHLTFADKVSDYHVRTRIDIIYNADTFFVISFTNFKDEAILLFEG
ncbi:hypothetical protein CPLU01_03351 [Colletotrichum plurivorum]|uniref:Uncharacterized protein n=1 Tax=Colletotrichum plurivorum TaxID=2175906 RepID=A0A8H6NKH9_9PEZI|nr:hypothetical protein CPLU01_03351 [Colletotrichum plurivorum]